MSPSHKGKIILIAVVVVLAIYVGFNDKYPTNLFCAFVEKANADCGYYPQSYYYDKILQLYPHNPYGHIWNLESGPPPYNSGSHVVAVGSGWYKNVGDLSRIRNEVATPHFALSRPYVGLGGNGPYNQDIWRQYGYIDRPDDWRNVEISGLFFPCADCEKAGQGPESVDFVLRGGVQDSTPPYNCEAPSYHIAFSWVGQDHYWKLERDIDHTEGYNNGQLTGDKLGAPIPPPLAGKVFGLKTVIYNNQANTKVRIDVYLDSTGTGSNWKLAWSYIDKGGDPLIDSVRGSIRCQGEHPDLPVTFGGPAVSFRINASHVDYRQLTVSEIIPPKF